MHLSGMTGTAKKLHVEPHQGQDSPSVRHVDLRLMLAASATPEAILDDLARYLHGRGHLIRMEVCSEALPLGQAQHRSRSALTTRQRDVLRLAALGMSNKEMARRLGLSHNTVRNHLKDVFGALGVGRREELISIVDRLDPVLLSGHERS
ncbi:MAG: LuxR C-terminal-related transcriptional regulator [Brevundimonas sp.]